MGKDFYFLNNGTLECEPDTRGLLQVALYSRRGRMTCSTNSDTTRFLKVVALPMNPTRHATLSSSVPALVLRLRAIVTVEPFEKSVIFELEAPIVCPEQ